MEIYIFAQKKKKKDENIHFYYKSAKHSSNFGFHMLKRKIEQTKVTRNYKA